MTLRWTRDGLDAGSDGVLALPLNLLDNLLRGVGQVMFQNNSYTGVLFVAGTQSDKTQSRNECGHQFFHGVSLVQDKWGASLKPTKKSSADIVRFPTHHHNRKPYF